MPPSVTTQRDRTQLPERTRDELMRLSTGKVYAFARIVEDIDAKESYFACSAGVVIRILRAPGYDLGTRPAHMQFFDLEGILVTECTKIKESSGAFFLRKFEPELIRSTCFELCGRPSFVPIPNKNDFFEVVPRSAFSVTAGLGLDPR